MRRGDKSFWHEERAVTALTTRRKLADVAVVGADVLTLDPTSRVEREHVGADNGDVGQLPSGGQCGHGSLLMPKRFVTPAHDGGAKTICQAPPRRLPLSAMPPTIRDVAAAAGVSPTTVSHALNGKGRVDAATRTRIADVADELGYRANRVARGLRSGRTGTIGLALPETSGNEAGAEMLGLDFYLQLAAGATRAAFSHDQALLLLPPL